MGRRRDRVDTFQGKGPYRVDTVETGEERAARIADEKKWEHFEELKKAIPTEKDHIKAVEMCFSTPIIGGDGKPFFIEQALIHTMLAIVERLK